MNNPIDALRGMAEASNAAMGSQERFSREDQLVSAVKNKQLTSVVCIKDLEERKLFKKTTIYSKGTTYPVGTLGHADRCLSVDNKAGKDLYFSISAEMDPNDYPWFWDYFKVQ